MRDSRRVAALCLLLGLGAFGAPAHAQSVGGARPYFADVTNIVRPVTFTTVAVDPQNGNRAYVGTNEGFIYRTLDGGSTWEEVVVIPQTKLYYGPERNGEQSDDYELGLEGKAFRLQAMIRQRGLTEAGVNLQQLLVKEGPRDTGIRHIAVDPWDGNVLFAATDYGVYRSADAGRTWVRAHSGLVSEAHRQIGVVAINPWDTAQVVAGSGRGIFASEDRGRTFRRNDDYYVLDSFIRFIVFHPDVEGVIFLASAGALYKSDDGGQSWRTAFWREETTSNDIHSVAISPFDPATVYVAGARGLWMSGEGGEFGTWTRMGKRFWDQPVELVRLPTDEVGHVLLSDGKILWESFDGGVEWKKLRLERSGHSLGWFDFRPEASPLVWAVTDNAIYKQLGPDEIEPLPPGAMDLARLRRYPSHWAVIHEALDHLGISQSKVAAYRRLATWRGLLPIVNAAYTRNPVLSDEAIFPDTCTVVSRSPDCQRLRSMFPKRPNTTQRPVFINGERVREEWMITANWDLRRLIFRLTQVHFGRVEDTIREARKEVERQIAIAYRQFIRLCWLMEVSPPHNPNELADMLLRIEGHTAYLDSLTDGWFSRTLPPPPNPFAASAATTMRSRMATHITTTTGVKP